MAQKPKIIMGGNGDKWVDPETTDESRIRLGLLVVVELEEVMVGFDCTEDTKSTTSVSQDQHQMNMNTNENISKYRVQ